MNILNKNNNLKKKLFNIILFTVYPLYILHSLIVSPLFTILYSNVAVPTFLPVILYFITVGIDILALWIMFSVTIYGLCKEPFKNIKNILFLCVFAPVFKYILKIIISPFIDGIPSVDTLLMDLYTIGISCSAEMLIFLLVVLIVYKPAQIYLGKKASVLKSANMLGLEDEPETVVLIPFKKMYHKDNPLQRGAVVSTFIITVSRLINLAISDISKGWQIFGINQYIKFFGAYFAEITVGIVGYFIMLYFYIAIYSKTKK